MAIRYLKIILVIFVGLQGLIYFIANIANWPHAVGAVGYVVSQQDHTVYPQHLVPALSGPVWATLALLVVLTGEFLVGALSLKGAWDLWRARRALAAQFNGAKTYAILGAGTAIVVWFGIFIVIGGALFQMWQTQLGQGSMRDALTFVATSALVLLFVTMDDRDL